MSLGRIVLRPVSCFQIEVVAWLMVFTSLGDGLGLAK
jgi:hypothetical protein